MKPDSAVDGETFRNDALAVGSCAADDLKETRRNCRGERGPDGHAGSRRLETGLGDAPVELLAADLPRPVQESAESAGMTEDDTVCVLEVLAEMQRIIDRHLEKTERLQGDR